MKWLTVLSLLLPLALCGGCSDDAPLPPVSLPATTTATAASAPALTPGAPSIIPPIVNPAQDEPVDDSPAKPVAALLPTGTQASPVVTVIDSEPASPTNAEPVWVVLSDFRATREDDANVFDIKYQIAQGESGGDYTLVVKERQGIGRIVRIEQFPITLDAMEGTYHVSAKGPPSLRGFEAYLARTPSAPVSDLERYEPVSGVLTAGDPNPTAASPADQVAESRAPASDSTDTPGSTITNSSTGDATSNNTAPSSTDPSVEPPMTTTADPMPTGAFEPLAVTSPDTMPPGNDSSNSSSSGEAPPADPALPTYPIIRLAQKLEQDDFEGLDEFISQRATSADLVSLRSGDVPDSTREKLKELLSQIRLTSQKQKSGEVAVYLSKATDEVLIVSVRRNGGDWKIRQIVVRERN